MNDSPEPAATASGRSGPSVSVAIWARPLPWALARARLFRRRQLRTAQGLPVPERPRRDDSPPRPAAGNVSSLRELAAQRRTRPTRQNFLAPTRAEAPSPRPRATPPVLRVARRGGSATAALVRAMPQRYQEAEPVALRKHGPRIELLPAAVLPRRQRSRLPRAAAVVAVVLVAVGGIAAAGWVAWGSVVSGVRALLVSAPAVPPGPPPANPAQRVSYYLARAKAGDAEAQLQLAVLYAKGEGTLQDYAAAAAWFRAAAEQGVARAQFDLGVLYERGRGVPVNMTEAGAWYRKAASQNYALAQFNLAVALSKGEGTRQDFFDAALWYRRAAEQGIVPAMVNLAILYEQGRGVEASLLDAYAWYKAAALRANEPARRRAEELFASFSPLDQTRAEMISASVAATIRKPPGADAPEPKPAQPPAPAPSANPASPPVLVPGLPTPGASSGDAP